MLLVSFAFMVAEGIAEGPFEFLRCLWDQEAREEYVEFFFSSDDSKTRFIFFLWVGGLICFFGPVLYWTLSFLIEELRNPPLDRYEFEPSENFKKILEGNEEK